jgi:hypothetical protein
VRLLRASLNTVYNGDSAISVTTAGVAHGHACQHTQSAAAVLSAATVRCITTAHHTTPHHTVWHQPHRAVGTMTWPQILATSSAASLFRNCVILVLAKKARRYATCAPPPMQHRSAWLLVKSLLLLALYCNIGRTCSCLSCQLKAQVVLAWFFYTAAL